MKCFLARLVGQFPTSSSPPPSGPEMLPAELGRRLVEGSKKGQRQAAKELGAVWAGLVSGPQDVEAGHRKKIFHKLILELPPPLRPVLAAQAERVIGANSGLSRAGDAARARLDAFLQNVPLIRDPAARERLTAAIHQEGTFPEHAVGDVMWQLGQAAMGSGAADPALWSRYVALVLEHHRLFGGRHASWIKPDGYRDSVTVEVCRTYEIINALHPMPLSIVGDTGDEVKLALSATFAAMGASSSLSSAVGEAARDILRNLARHVPKDEALENIWAVKDRARVLTRALCQKSPEAIITIRDGMQALLISPEAGELTSRTGLSWPDICLRILAEHKDESQLPSAFAAIKEAVSFILIVSPFYLPIDHFGDASPAHPPSR